MTADVDPRPVVCFVCTGNAARSVMARTMLADRTPQYRALGAGTLVLEGHPMSQRTRRALERLGLHDGTHRSRQFGPDHATADLVVAMEPEHVQWVRRNYPEAASRTGTLLRLVRDLPTEGTLGERVAGLGLAEVAAEGGEEVVDPASGDQAVFDSCADVLDGLVDRLILRLP